MADYEEKQIKFGWLTMEEMTSYISSGQLSAYDVCFVKDTHEEYLINANLVPIPIKSKVRIYGSVESAIADINETQETYSGELLAIKENDRFVAYIVNESDNEYYVTPVYSDTTVDYDIITNTPIKNLTGTVDSPIILADLSDNFYKIKGVFVTPNGESITSIVGNYVFVEQTDENTKTIKRISNTNIYDYVIENGVVTSDKYATENFVTDKGYATENYVDTQLEAFKITVQEMIEKYVEETCTLLIKHIVDEELDSRYSSNQDIENLFNEN